MNPDPVKWYHKICSRCEKEKHINEFCHKSRNKDGLNNKCRACESEIEKARYRSNKPKYIEKATRWQERYYYKHVLVARQHARRKKAKNREDEGLDENETWAP